MSSKRRGLVLDLEAVGDDPLLLLGSSDSVEARSSRSGERRITDARVGDVRPLSYGSTRHVPRAIDDDTHTYHTIDGAARGGACQYTAVADHAAAC